MKQHYYRHKLTNLLVVNKIVTIHDLTLPKDFSHGESHDFWELLYVRDGLLRCQTDRGERVLTKGEIIFHAPNEAHTHASHASSPHVFIISFECKSDAMRFFEGKTFSIDTSLLHDLSFIVEEGKHTFDIPVSDPALKKMPLHTAPPIGGLQVIKNVLEIFLIRMMRRESEREDSDSVFLEKAAFESRLAEQIAQILEENVHASLSMDTLAGMLNYNKSYLFRQFKSATGKTVMAHFTELKIREAKKLLATTDMTVAEISDFLSFDTPNYFSKTFRRITGTTPSAYRKGKIKK